MNAAPILFIATCVLSGCASSKHGANATLLSSDLPTPSPAPRSETPVVYVDGQFYRPGIYTLTNGMRLKDAIAAAGGLNEYALHLIWLQHPGEPKQQYKWSAKRPLTNNPVLWPGDRLMNPQQ